MFNLRLFHKMGKVALDAGFLEKSKNQARLDKFSPIQLLQCAGVAKNVSFARQFADSNRNQVLGKRLVVGLFTISACGTCGDKVGLESDYGYAVSLGAGKFPFLIQKQRYLIPSNYDSLTDEEKRDLDISGEGDFDYPHYDMGVSFSGPRINSICVMGLLTCNEQGACELFPLEDYKGAIVEESLLIRNEDVPVNRKHISKEFAMQYFSELVRELRLVNKQPVLTLEVI